MKREKITPHEGDSRFIRRDSEGKFTDNQVDIGKSLAADQRTHAKTEVKSGDGDRGDQKKR